MSYRIICWPFHIRPFHIHMIIYYVNLYAYLAINIVNIWLVYILYMKYNTYYHIQIVAYMYKLKLPRCSKFQNFLVPSWPSKKKKIHTSRLSWCSVVQNTGCSVLGFDSQHSHDRSQQYIILFIGALSIFSAIYSHWMHMVITYM